MGTFASIPDRGNQDDVVADFWNALKRAGVNIENFLGAGFIAETHFALANNQAVAANVTGLLFDHTLYTSARVDCEINRKTGSNEIVANGRITALWRALTSTWDVVYSFDGDDPDTIFTITALGQVQYTTGNLTGTGYVGNIKFKAVTFGV